MSNETPGRDPVPGWGQPTPEPAPEEATAPWPTEAAPPEAPRPTGAEPPATPWPAAAEPSAAAPAPAAPTPDAPTAPWDAPGPVAPAPAPVAPVTPAPAPAWGAPQQPVPQQPVAPVPTPAPAWGAPQQPVAPVPVAPPQQAPSWGAPAQQQPPGGWAPPPQQAPGWGPAGPGVPGGPPVGWAPAPAKSGGNGCLKGCLIVGAIGIVLVIVGFVALGILAQRFAEDMGVNPDGTLTECAILSSEELSDALDGSAEALPLGGIVDATIGQLLDKRIIADAEDCWIAGDNTATGRVARQAGGDASGGFRSAKEAAVAGAYFAGDVPNLGDEAFCTGMSEAGSFGILVRRGDQLVYVSLINPSITSGSGFQPNEDGVITSPETCALAGRIADKVIR